MLDMRVSLEEPIVYAIRNELQSNQSVSRALPACP